MKKKTGRNEPCPCGSGKKFKKCCESKMIGKKYLAHKIEKADTTSNKIASLTTLIPPSIPKSMPIEEKPVVSELEKEEQVAKQPKKVAKKATKTVKKIAKKKTPPKKS